MLVQMCQCYKFFVAGAYRQDVSSAASARCAPTEEAELHRVQAGAPSAV